MEAEAEARAAEKAEAEARAAEAARAREEAAREAAAREEAAAAAAAAAGDEPAAWGVSASEKAKFDAIFAQMSPEKGLVSGAVVAPVLKKSGLDTGTLRDIWNLVDVSKDGVLDADTTIAAKR